MPLRNNRIRKISETLRVRPMRVMPPNTFRKILVVLVVGPRVDPTGYSPVGKYREDVGGSERERRAGLVEYPIEIHRICFP